MTGEQARDPEAVLLDEPTTADLRSKVTEAWREFARALAALLPTLTAGAILAAIPVVALFLFLQRYIVSGLTGGAVKG